MHHLKGGFWLVKGEIKGDYKVFGSNSISFTSILLYYKGEPEIVIMDHKHIEIKY